jgi:hypothetical protein
MGIAAEATDLKIDVARIKRVRARLPTPCSSEACWLNGQIAKASACGLDIGIGRTMAARPGLRSGFRVSANIVAHHAARYSPQQARLLVGGCPPN